MGRSKACDAPGCDFISSCNATTEQTRYHPAGPAPSPRPNPGNRAAIPGFPARPGLPPLLSALPLPELFLGSCVNFPPAQGIRLPFRLAVLPAAPGLFHGKPGMLPGPPRSRSHRGGSRRARPQPGDAELGARGFLGVCVCVGGCPWLVFFGGSPMRGAPRARPVPVPGTGAL